MKVISRSIKPECGNVRQDINYYKAYSEWLLKSDRIVSTIIECRQSPADVVDYFDSHVISIICLMRKKFQVIYQFNFDSGGNGKQGWGREGIGVMEQLFVARTITSLLLNP